MNDIREMNDTQVTEFKRYLKSIGKQQDLYEKVMMLNAEGAHHDEIMEVGGRLNAQKLDADSIRSALAASLGLDLEMSPDDWDVFKAQEQKVHVIMIDNGDLVYGEDDE